MLKNKLFAVVFALAMVVGVTASAAYTFPGKITTKQEKMDVQTVLNMATGSKLTVDGVLGAKSIAAVKAFQTMKGLVADGKIGPMTRAALEAASVGGTVVTPVTPVTPGTPVVCPAGFTCTPAAGTPVTPVVTTGATEGYMTLQSAPVAITTAVNQSEKGDSIMAFSVKAKGSNINVQRINVSLASDKSALPWKYFTTLYLYQDSTLLGTLPVSSTSLTENSFGMNYSAVFNGLNVAIPQEGTANFVVKADIVDTVVSSPAVYTIGINDAANANSVRGVDAVGLTQYVKSTNAYDRPINFGSSATGKITVVANGANPIAQNVVTSTTTTTTGITALIFDLQNTSKYDVTLKTLSATLGYNNTTVSGYYLYDGSSIVASVGNPGSTTLSFGNLPSNFVVAANSTKTLTIKMDAAMNGTGAQSVSVASSQITAVDSSSNLITPTGSATGSDQTLQSTGVIVNLVSATATSVASTSGVSGYATGTFVFTVKANGVNLAKLSTVLPSANGTTTPGYIRALATAGGSVLTNVNYTVTPDTVVSDGSQVTVTLTTTKTTTAPGNVTFTIGSLEFENAAMTALLTPITTGLSTFHATVWAN